MTAPESPFLRDSGARAREDSPAGGVPTPPERCQNFLAAGARFEGTLTVEDSIRLEGTFSGKINTSGTLQITSGAQVQADVRASYVVIAGNFEGQVDSEQRVDLLPPGRIRADLRTRRLVVEDGAQFDGKIEMQPGSSSLMRENTSTGRESTGRERERRSFPMGRNADNNQ
jgi:cytoskeletal protein CcmA (bactofilin family)